MDREEIQRALDAFEQNPGEALRRLPEKKDATGRAVIDAPTAFSEEDIRSLDFVRQKDALRQQLSTVAHGVILAAIDEGTGWGRDGISDSPEDLVDTLRHEKLADIDAAGLASAALPETPWSSDYWPTYLGLLGRRYADPKFPASRRWKKNFEHIEAHPSIDIWKSGDSLAIERLAPSEKYDLLVGDGNSSLTAAMWEEGKSYDGQSGEVESWMGICDGWAAASYMLPRPRRDVRVLAADGKTELRFYPDDIKALAALLWAKARVEVRFIGGRSSDKKPKTDEVGRLISPEAFDTNPGTFHLACVNQVGVSKRSFIMDSTYDYEVWNQPITAYESHYFNPQEMQAAPDLRSATVSRGDFTKDRFSKYRGAEAAAFAGVYMRVRYVGETRPSHVPNDGPERDLIVTVDYTYDLELSADGRIIGGEWYKNAHPDFLWTPPPGVRAVTPADYFARGEWDPARPMPTSWRNAAFRASLSMLPLAKIVERLIQLANA